MSYWTQKDDLTFIPLTEEQERTLFERYYKGGKKGLEARDTVIQHHLKHVTKLALRFAKAALPDDIAVSAGVDGLMQAMKSKRFNPHGGFRFASYVRPFIRGKVLRAMRDHHIMPSAEPVDISFQGEGAALTGTLCDDTWINYEAVYRNDYVPIEQIPAPEQTVDHEAEERDLSEYRKRIINECIAKLRPRDANVVRKVALEGMTLAEVAAEDGHRRQNVGPCYKRGMARLKILLEKHREELGV